MEFFPQLARPTIAVDQLTTCAEGLDHPEGLAFDRDGLLWAGGEAGQLYRIAGETVDEAGNVGGFCLGVTLSREQEIFICNVGLHSLQRVSRDGKVLQSWESASGRPLRTPNFSVFDAEGSLYFSDSGEWNGKDGMVYRLRASGVIDVFAGPFAFANGLALSASGDALFVAESQMDQVVRIEIREDGSAGNTEIYASGLARVPDGLALDEAGNLFVTCYATDCIYRVTPQRVIELYAFDPEGTLLARPTNIAFGGEGRRTMYVANLGRWHIASLPSEHSGQRLTAQESVR